MITALNIRVKNIGDQGWFLVSDLIVSFSYFNLCVISYRVTYMVVVELAIVPINKLLNFTSLTRKILEEKEKIRGARLTILKMRMYFSVLI